ncbi:MAG: hypothetical protein F4160_05260 [Rhodospirillaceae bacterium]|nr:hypothetical protein [Rhodospirillaceae bacterium]MYH36192.1 hypothetical protein [Rhodospirillaceae bacterium]
MNNVLRGEYVENMVAALLAPHWVQPWKSNHEWSLWDLERKRGGRTEKLEIKQSARMQPWGPVRSPPRFDIAPKRDFNRLDEPPCRRADAYVFAWHAEVGDAADHRDPAQWVFFVAATRSLPPDQKTVSLGWLRRNATQVGFDQLPAVLDAALTQMTRRR